MKRLALVLAAAVLVAIWWFIHSLNQENAATAAGTPSSTAPSSTAATSSTDSKTPASPPPLEISDLAKNLNSPNGTIQADLRIVLDCIENFRTNFPRDGNPVGSNAEITAALTGQNKLRYAVISPTHPAINRAGELCDRWGTPFFFHAESGTRMTIRSAGPDKKLHTDDDLVLSP